MPPTSATKSTPAKQAKPNLLKTPDVEREKPIFQNSVDLATLTKTVSVSTIMGASVGVAARRLSSDALYGAGLCFAGLQCLSYLGFITIHWSAVAAAVEKVADQNNDGKLDMEDARIMWRRLSKFLMRGVPDAAGFTSGVVIGYRFLA